MEGKLQHFFHNHPLILKTEVSERKIKCDGCLTTILGPFYSCKKCRYFLHKVCAELPNKFDHPMHPKHSLTLFSKPPTTSVCDLCRKTCEGFVYHCSECRFDADITCVAALQTIEDKCHSHPLVPVQFPSSFPCHICLKTEENVSYKCTVCPFWVHQSCILLLPNAVKHSDHHHTLTLLQSVPVEKLEYSYSCDICHDKLSWFQCTYYCEICMFFAHISCARSESTEASTSSRNQNVEISLDPLLDGQRQSLLPLQQKSTELISWFVENYIDHGTKVNRSNLFLTRIIGLLSWLFEETKHHKHPLFLIDEQTNEKTCEACAVTISPPSYGCIECDYFLHNCCTELPKYIHHPSHSGHLLVRGSINGFFRCQLCHQWCNGFSYKCFEGDSHRIDIKCASLLKPIYHESHKHLLTPRVISSSICSACNFRKTSECILKCDLCSFNLCFRCALAPPVMKHRYGKSHPFILTYLPPENHYNEYMCEICERGLNPKHWFYHSIFADQFTHVSCMIKSAADSNIKFGKYYTVLNIHEHKLTYVSCNYDSSRCNYCHEPLKTGFSVGFECIPCKFKIHLECLIPMDDEKKRSTSVTVSKEEEKGSTSVKPNIRKKTY